MDALDTQWPNSYIDRLMNGPYEDLELDIDWNQLSSFTPSADSLSLMLESGPFSLSEPSRDECDSSLTIDSRLQPEQGSWLIDWASDNSISREETTITTVPTAAEQRQAPTSPRSSKQKTSTRKEHYRIEKRYRTNINDKIRALEEMLPTDTTAAKDASLRENSIMRRSKGEVLSRVIEYLGFLQSKKDAYEKKIEDLKERMRASQRALGL